MFLEDSLRELFYEIFDENSSQIVFDFIVTKEIIHAEFLWVRGGLGNVDMPNIKEFLGRGLTNSWEKVQRWMAFFDYFIMEAKSNQRIQLLSCLSYFNSKSEVHSHVLKQCMLRLRSEVDQLVEIHDQPYAPNFYGLLVSELVRSRIISPEEAVTDYQPDSDEIKYMKGLVEGLLSNSGEGRAIVQENTSVFLSGFRKFEGELSYTRPSFRDKIKVLIAKIQSLQTEI